MFRVKAKILSPRSLPATFSLPESNYLNAKFYSSAIQILPSFLSSYFCHRFKLSNAMKPADTEVHDLCMYLIASPLTS